MDTRKNTLVLLGLGADIELTIVPKGGFPLPAADAPEPRASTSRLDAEDAMDVDDDDDSDAPPVSTSRVKSARSASARGAKSAAKTGRKKGEDMLITLIHGDILMLNGDEFEVSSLALISCFTLTQVLQWSLRRTGMSIRTFAYFRLTAHADQFSIVLIGSCTNSQKS